MVRPLLFLLLLLPSICLAQLKLYESTFNGGVVGGGYSNGATVPSGSGTFSVNIPVGSTVRKAYLIAGRCGNSPNVTVTLNGTPYTFSQATNSVTSGFQTLYGGSSGVHAIDITASISTATSTYTIAAPVQSNTVSDKFPEFYLYIAFNNAGLPAINSAIYLNTVDMNVSSYSWNLNTTQSVGNGSPVGFALLGGYATTGGDCENVTVNGTALGSFGGQDFNASSQWGCMAGFQYYNNTLTGYNDDNANQAISGTDALSNIQAVLPGSTNSIPVLFTHCSGGSDNHVWATFLTWGGTILDGNILGFDAQPVGCSSAPELVRADGGRGGQLRICAQPRRTELRDHRAGGGNGCHRTPRNDLGRCPSPHGQQLVPGADGGQGWRGGLLGGTRSGLRRCA
ncbi:MAG: hypothetical protein U0176_21060 [Bacteroidia bacterium]